jgi:DNA-binding MarR family transcriptional regulator
MTKPDYTPDAVRTLARLSRVLERGAGDLTLQQVRILTVVDDGGERASWLADRLALAKPTITSAVDGLVERGYLCRTADTGDRRAIRITLTQAGRRALETAEQAMAQRLTDVLAHAEDSAAVVWALSELGTALDRARTERLARDRS